MNPKQQEDGCSTCWILRYEWTKITFLPFALTTSFDFKLLRFTRFMRQSGDFFLKTEELTKGDFLNFMANKLHEAKISTAHLCWHEIVKPLRSHRANLQAGRCFAFLATKIGEVPKTPIQVMVLWNALFLENTADRCRWLHILSEVPGVDSLKSQLRQLRSDYLKAPFQKWFS